MTPPTDERFREDAYLQSCETTVLAVGEGGIELEQTVFYPTGGGQPGDRGVLRLEDGSEIAITEAVKNKTTGAIVHIPPEGAQMPTVGHKLTAVLDWDRRHKLMRMHTAMHLLCSLVEGDVTGGQVGTEKSRLDFNIAESPDKEALAENLNRIIGEDHPVTSSWISDDELDANPDMVRTMSVQPPRGSGRVRIINVEGVDLQPCGGTHVKSTAEIGLLRIGKIENKGKQNRRINIHFAE